MINPVRLPKWTAASYVKWVGSMELAYTNAINVIYSAKPDTGFTPRFWIEVKSYCEKRLPILAQTKEELIAKYKPVKEEKKDATKELSAPAEAKA